MEFLATYTAPFVVGLFVALLAFNIISKQEKRREVKKLRLSFDGFKRTMYLYADYMRNYLGMDSYSVSIEPVVSRESLKTAGTILLTKMDGSIKKGILFKIGDYSIRSNEFFQVEREEIYNSFGNFDEMQQRDYPVGFGQFLDRQASKYNLSKDLFFTKFLTECYDLTFFGSLHSEEEKKAPTNFANVVEASVDYQSETSKNVANIKRVGTNLSKMVEEVDDIDITVSISELIENSNEVLKQIDEKRQHDKKGAWEFAKEYLESISKVKGYVSDFKKKKNDNALSVDEENRLQDLIEGEVSKWTKIFNE